MDAGGFYFMLFYDIEAFMQQCQRKGLAVKTLSSYEQTLRLFELYLREAHPEIKETHKISHAQIADYIRSIQARGKYTICYTKEPTSPNYPENRKDYGRKVSAITINNYLRNMNVFFRWCAEEGIIRQNPIRRSDFIKVESENRV
jgi:integrase/recombinase XerD